MVVNFRLSPRVVHDGEMRWVGGTAMRSCVRDLVHEHHALHGCNALSLMIPSQGAAKGRSG